MAGKQEVKLTFAGDDKTLSRTMDKVGKNAEQMQDRVGRASSDMASKGQKATSSLGKSFQYAKGVILAGGIQAAIGGVAHFIGSMVDEAREAQKVSASTAQGIATIGAASWTSAKQIGDLSQKISEKIGVDDELIQQSANLLLTFRNIKNAAGENNDIFDRAVAASQDLAAKGFGDANSAAKMLGKALNDPVKGITALSKAGVTFTQGQKDLIKKLVESGDVLGAQKIIMGELEDQVGGTAAATATAGDKMAVTWANFQENLGTAVLPILDGLLNKLSGVLQWASENPVIVGAIAAITAGIWLLNAALNANPIILVITLVAALAIALVALWQKSAAFRGFFIGMWNGIKNLVGTVVQWIKDRWNGLVSWFRSIPGAIGRALGSLGSIIGGVFKGAVNVLINALNWGVDRINSLIHGMNAAITLVPGVSGIPDIPHIPTLHSGGVVPGMLGQDVLTVLQAGEHVTPRGQGGGGGMTVTFAGDTDGAFATAFMKLVRAGVIRIA